MEQHTFSENNFDKPRYKEAPRAIRILRYRIKRSVKEVVRFAGCPSTEALKVLVVGNRITAVSWGIIIASAVALVVTQNPSLTLCIGGGLLLLCASEFGIGTLQSYRETRQKLLKGNTLTLQDIMDQEGESSGEKVDPKNIGYCRMQGIYLAFRALGMEDSFRRIFPSQKLKNF